MAKENVRFGEKLTWSDFSGKSSDDFVKEIFNHATGIAQKSINWYWQSIKLKKASTLTIRFFIFFLVAAGALMPILSGLFTDVEIRLRLTQSGVAALAFAGLLEASDRVFGWSSGWLRYITTVLSMEDLMRRFKLDWFGYLFTKKGEPDDEDKKPLFDIARKFEAELSKIQNDETDKWVSEFNTSTAVLRELIKTHREAAQRTADDEKERYKANKPGMLETKLSHRGEPVAVDISIDNNEPVSFTGLSWARSDITEGLHIMKITSDNSPKSELNIPFKIDAGEITVIEIEVP